MNPRISAAFNTACVASCTVLTCSCTAPDGHWSSSTDATNPQIAWGVSFGSGSTVALNKGGNASFRAVRGGS